MGQITKENLDIEFQDELIERANEIGDINLLGNMPRSLSKTVSEREINVKDYGVKGDNVTNDSIAIQALHDSLAKTGGGTMFFPAGTYVIDQPIVITSPSIRIKGVGYLTVFKKTSATISDNLTRTYTDGTGAQSYTFSDPAIFNIVFPNNSYQTYFNIESVRFYTASDYSVGVFNAPRLAHSSFKNLISDGSKYFFKGLNGWLCSFENIRSRYSNIHFDIKHGTSHFFKNVHCDQKGNAGTAIGFNIDGLVYSSFEACGADNLSICYSIKNKATITLNGCGTETYSRSLQINDATVSINGGEYEFHLSDGITSENPWIFENNARVTLNGSTLITKDFVSGGGNWANISKPIIQTGAKVASYNSALDIDEIPNINTGHFNVSGNNSQVVINDGLKNRYGWSTGSNSKDDYTFKLQGIDKTITVPLNAKTEIFRIKNSAYGTSVIGKAEIYAFSDYSSSIGGILYNTITFSGSDKTDKFQSVTKVSEQNAVMTQGAVAPTVAYTAERNSATNDLVIYVTLTGSSTFKPYTFNLDINYQGRLGIAHTRMECL